VNVCVAGFFAQPRTGRPIRASATARRPSACCVLNRISGFWHRQNGSTDRPTGPRWAKNPATQTFTCSSGTGLKLQGRRTAALARMSGRPNWLPSRSRPARAFSHGRAPEQEYLFEAQLRLGGVEALTAITHQIVELRETLTSGRGLAGHPGANGFPLSCYDSFAHAMTFRSAPGARFARFRHSVVADRRPLETLFAQLSAVRSQACEVGRCT